MPDSWLANKESGYNKVTPIEASVSFRMALACRAHRNLAVASLAPFGLYVGQELILAQLWSEEGVTQSCLAGRVGIDLSTMTKALQRMERYGLIERRSDTEDIRATRVFLTEQGRALQPQITAMWHELEERTLAGFTGDERAFLAKLLQRVEQNLT